MMSYYVQLFACYDFKERHDNCSFWKQFAKMLHIQVLETKLFGNLNLKFRRSAIFEIRRLVSFAFLDKKLIP